MKVEITVIDPLGKHSTETLDDGGAGVILIGNARENAESNAVLRLASDAIDARHALLEFGREVSATAFERQHGDDETPVCHLMVLSDKGNVYRADNPIATPHHQFIPWYRGDAYLFGDYTLLFEQEDRAQVPFTVEITPRPAEVRDMTVAQPLMWQITVKTTAERIPNVDLALLRPEGWSEEEWKAVKNIVKVEPPLVNINETRSGTATLTITIPKDLRFRGGPYTFLLQATSREYQFYKPLDTKIRINLQPFTAFEFQPQPGTATEQTIPYFRTWWLLPQYWFTLQNQSNHDETFTVTAKDNGGKSRYWIEPFTSALAATAEPSAPPEASNPHAITLAPGAQTDLRVIMRPRGRRHIGIFPKPYTIKVEAKPQQGVQPQGYEFTLRQRPFIPSILAFLFFVALGWLALSITTPHITQDLVHEPYNIAPTVPVTLTWQTAGIVDTLCLTINNTPCLEPIDSVPAWHRLATTYHAQVIFPREGIYTITVKATNIISDLWPINWIYGQDFYSDTLPVLPELTVSPAFTIRVGEISALPLTLSFTPTAGITPTVHYTITDGTTRYGTHYRAFGYDPNLKQAHVLTFTPQVSKTISFLISAASATAYQRPVTFTVTFGNPQDVLFTADRKSISTTVTITDERGLPQLVIKSIPVVETAKFITFTAELNLPSDEDLRFTVVPTGGEALPGKDYISTPQIITMKAGITSTTFTIGVIDDKDVEGSESFHLQLTSSTDKIRLPTSVLNAIINDDETGSTLSISDAQNSEADQNLNFAITTTPHYVAGPITVTVSVRGQSAIENVDFLPLATQKITIPIAAESPYSLSIPIVQDVLNEPDETLVVTLADVQPVNVILGRAEAIGKIIDDETTATLLLEDAVANERDGTIAFALKLSSVLGEDVTVTYTIENESAQAGADFVVAQNTSVIRAGETNPVIRLQLVMDEMYEKDETFKVRIETASASSGNIAPVLVNPQASGRILNDDPVPTLSVSDANATELDPKICFTVNLSNPSDQEIQVNYYTADGTAKADKDYEAVSAGLLVIAPGAQSGRIEDIGISTDLILDDAVGETFTLVLANPSNATIGDGEGIGVIYDIERSSTVTFPPSSCMR